MIRAPTAEELQTTIPKVSRGWSNFEHEEESSKGFFFTPSQIEGTIPAELRGSFVRNGPGLNIVYGTPLTHPIDGDGLVAKLTFCDQKAHFQARFVATKSHEEEKKAKRMLYNGSMGTRIRGAIPGAFRDPSHTNVFLSGDKLFATYEYTLPHTLNPNTLDTIGPSSVDGALELKAMSAHFRVDAEKQLLVTVGFKAATPPSTMSRISFYEWSLTHTLVRATRLELDTVNYAHDFLLTPTWFIVHVTPFVDTTMETYKKIVKGDLAPGETMRFNPKLPSQFVLIERNPATPSSRRIIRLDTEPCHIFHFANCREGPDGKISFEACCLPEKFTMEWQHHAFLANTADAPGVMFGYQVDPNKSLISRKNLPGLETTGCEFPTTNPFRNCLPLDKAHLSTRYMYLMAGRPGQALPFSDVVKYDTQTQTQKRWRCELGSVGEPCFVPRLGPGSAFGGGRRTMDGSFAKSTSMRSIGCSLSCSRRER